MARLARVVIPGVPHHVIQRGNRRQRTFWKDGDYREYLRLMAAFCKAEKVQVWSYCLMPNHVHLIAVPKKAESFHRAIGEAHRRYTRFINFQKKWRGYLWQGRFSSYPLDDPDLYEAGRYVEHNPVVAKLVKVAWCYRWSSARAPIEGEDDEWIRVSGLLSRVEDWKSYLQEGVEKKFVRAFERHERTGRPLGDLRFLRRLERTTGQALVPKSPGRPPKK